MIRNSIFFLLLLLHCLFLGISYGCELKINEVTNGNGDFLFKHSIIIKASDTIAPDTIVLHYSDRNLNFVFELQTDDSVECSGFDYRLIGYDQSWYHSQAERSLVRYSNLSGGEYSLVIKYRTGQKNSTYHVPIHIDTPFWETALFYLFIGLVALAGLLFYINSRVKNIRRVKVLLEKQVNARTKDIEKKTEKIEEQKEKIFEQRNVANKQTAKIAEQKEELERQRIELQRLVREQSNDLALAKRQMAEKSREIQVSQSKYQLLAENSRDMIFRLKLPEDVMEYVSPASHDLTGYTPEEFYSNTGLFRKIVAKESREHYINARRRMLSGETIPSLEFKIITKSGAEKWLSQRNVIAKGRNGEIEALEAIVFDVTGQKKDVSAINAAKIRAEESERLKSAFLSSMSHEIRTPMNAIVGFADLLKDPNIDGEEKQHYIEEINESSSSLLRLIDDMIDVAKLEAGELVVVKGPVELDSLCQETWERFSKRTEEFPSLSAIDFSLNLDSSINGVVIQTDKGRLQQVIDNLLSNALKFTDSGSVKFSARVSGEMNQLIEVSVADTGSGIPAEKQLEIFDRYRRVRSGGARSSGAGLGLSISRSLIDLLGGELTVESQSGKGTVFTFTLPFEDAKVAVVPKEVKVSEPGVIDWSDKHILVAEDEDNNFKFMVAALKKTKVNLMRAKDGVEAIEMFKQKQHLVDMVLMDIQMPKMNGYDSTRELLKIDEDLPIVAQTAFAMSGGKIKCFDAGCIGYISKPYKAKDLIDVITKHIR